MQKIAKVGDAAARKEMAILEKFKQILESGKNVRSYEASEEELAAVADLSLLTIKPVIYVANVEEDHLHEDNQFVKALKENVAPEGAQ